MNIKEKGERIRGKYRVLEAFPFVEGVLYYVEEEGEENRWPSSPGRTRFVHAIDSLSVSRPDWEALRTRHEDIFFPLREVFVEEGVLYQVFYRLEGTLLAHRIEKSGPLSLDEALWILHGVAVQVLRLYEFGQFAVVHPQNILITSGKAIRFFYGGPLGLLPKGRTPPAGAKESRNRLSLHHSVDTFAVGALGYALLTGKRFTSQAPDPAPIRSFRSDVPAALEKWVMRACSFDRSEQPHLAEIAEVFQRMAATVSY
jgi:hypothetical protein